jgi:hypothetical protein
VLASGVVISLTALTGGVAPAFAKPGGGGGGGGHGSPETTIVEPAPEPPQQEQQAPEPKQQAPEPKQQAPEPKQQAPEPKQQAPAEPAPEAPAATPPKTQVTEAPAVQEPEPVAPKAPATAVAPPVTSVQQAEPTATEPTSKPTESKATESKPTDAGPTASEPPSVARKPAAESEPSDPSSVAPESPTGQTPADKSAESAPAKPGEPAPAGDTDAPGSPASSPKSEANGSEPSQAKDSGESEKPTVSVRDAAKEIKTIVPETVDAPKEDVELARKAEPIFQPQPAVASKDDVASFSSGIESSLKIPGLDVGVSTKTQFGVERRRDVDLVSPVRQWRPDWISYDEYYRPVILNPFHNPVRLVYMYDHAPRIVIIPPLARMVIDAARYAAYSFTAAVLAPVVAAVNTVNAVVDTAQALTNIAVGSFFGGGYYPGVGLPLPPPPPPVLRYDNVPVFVNYSQAQYEPFRVRQVVDVGDDPQYGERKVLLDGSTPAWGQWTQSPTGERQFEIHKTQQFPGLDAPAEGPLPGDYKLRLLSDQQHDNGYTSRDIFLFVAAGVIGTLGFGAIGMAFYLGRRRPQH